MLILSLDQAWLTDFNGNADRCKSCQKFGHHFKKLAAEKADWVSSQTGHVVKRNTVRIASIEWSKSRALCDSLGITRLPTVQVYSQGKKVSQLAVPASQFSKVRDAVDHLTSLPLSDLGFAAKMEEGEALIQSNILDSRAAGTAALDAAEQSLQKSQEEMLKAPPLEEPRGWGKAGRLLGLRPRFATSAAVPAERRGSESSLSRRWWIQDE